MLVVLLALLLHMVACVELEIQGTVSFEVLYPEERSQHRFRVASPASPASPGTSEPGLQAEHNMTVAPEMECIYQYPEADQINTILSNMMNELTKMSVRVKDFINEKETRRSKQTNWHRDELHPGSPASPEMKNTTTEPTNEENKHRKKAVKKASKNQKKAHKKLNTDHKKKIKKNDKEVIKTESEKKEEKHDVEKGPPRQKAGNKRFSVVKKKETEFFELIYANMTNEYRSFYNSTSERVDRSGRDPCLHQEELKQMWRTLLDSALDTLRRAAELCVEEHLRERRVDPRDGLRTRLHHYVSTELARVRAAQLSMLCDTYQLCYHDLLKEQEHT